MSREGLRRFVHALEHSASLRRELAGCDDDDGILALARRLDFAVSASDLIEDPQSTSLDGWWKRSALGLRHAGDRD